MASNINHLETNLEKLEQEQLVHVSDPGLEHTFKNALTQEAAYESLLLRRRRAIHSLVAQAYENLFSESLDSYAAILAEHFAQAGNPAKTLTYAVRAAQAAERVFASTEAVAHYTRALASAREQRQPEHAILLARGRAHELVGAFERAAADYQAAQESAERHADAQTQWQALLNLGFLWLGVDYARAGEFFGRALEVAETLQDPRPLAHTLNRIANWQVNTGRAADGVAGHYRALDIFRRVGDQQGTAETLDLLGMAEGMVGNRAPARRALEQAIRLFRTLGDQQSLAGALLTRMAWGGLASDVLGQRRSQRTFQRDMEEASAIVKQTGWAAGEAMLGLVAGLSLASFGQIGRGLHECMRGLRVATEIGHKQWMAGNQFALGQIHVDLGEFEQGARYAQAGLTLARELDSAWWIGHCTTALAQALLRSGDLAAAEKVVNDAFRRDTKPETIFHRRMLSVWIEWELARGNPEAALALADRSIPTARTPFILQLRGQALLALGDARQALAPLRKAREEFLALGARISLWTVHADLGRAYAQQAQPRAARREFQAAHRIVQELAATIDDADLRAAFLRFALKRIPAIEADLPRA